MKKPLFIISCSTLLLVAPPLAHAGFYLGGGAGISQIQNYPKTTGASYDDSNVTGKVYAGYQFHKNVALEAAYHHLGNIKGNFSGVVAEAKAFGGSLQVVAKLPVTEKTALFIKGGGLYTRVVAEASYNALSASAKDARVAPVLGIGAETDISNQIKLRAEVEHVINVGNAGTTGQADITTFTASANYNF
ncbi:outer membrane beta-barrel protein [Magnetococcus sp. PR-3]|uniref:outer membrane beta-barrel protein n=1 Tax=Magnetococcus sp. PR-3 TaxID=3120355 RepID=UPI002FCE59EF